MRTLYNDTLARVALSPAARTNGTVNGVAVDMSVFNNDFRTVQFVVVTGAITDGTHAISVEESADGSTAWGAVPAARVQGALPSIASADDDKVYQIGVIMGDKAFFRVVAVTSGVVGAGGIFGAVALAGGGSTFPPNRS